MPKEHYPVINCGNDPATHISNQKTVEAAQAATGKRNSVTRKVLIQKLEMGADGWATFQDKNVSRQKDAEGKKHT